ncbi:MAG: phosphatidylserine decarboxylase family protein [Deltaproteobacteria bacterium]|nr:phosphatidylserine decarboxylase family protein [Deltaproteobacteria bacterium]MBW1951653.1 phosphatidylserine decarboxylase family protein [Deltaproteobacteria bacterium]MBW1985753.1 phosphatidylserine decarboxylase family protein [Deltaproteobacteria bacterium]MBW2134666.1 phosphatidylserine decarboxylase family protein [Deltaproteobacteria bacterium]
MKAPSGPIAHPGFLFIGGGVAMLLVGLWSGSRLITLVGLGMMGFFTYFFRDPERPITSEPAAIVSPADGRIIFLGQAQEDQFLHQPMQRVSIFMNLFDVHVNRAPIAAQVKAMAYRPGQFVPANHPESSQVNEQQSLWLETESGQHLVMVQIAGVLARRIITYVREHKQVQKGERVGLICFGSRVDLYLPEEWTLSVKLGDRVKAGSSILGRLS